MNLESDLKNENKSRNMQNSLEDNFSDTNITDNTLDHNFSKEKSILFLLVIIVVGIIAISYVKDNFLSKYFDKINPMATNVGKGSGYLESYDPIKSASDDTDGDGVSNWREVTAGTDPEDKTSTPGNTESKTILVTATTSLTKLAANDLLVLSKYKEKYPDMNVDSLTAGLASNYEKLLLPNRIIDIDLVINPSPTLIRNYGNYMGIGFTQIFLNSDFVELKELKEDNSEFTKTKLFLKDLEEVCISTRKINNIPENYSELHKDFVYNCELYTSMIKGILSIKEDNVRGLVSVGKYQPVFDSIYLNFNNYIDMLEKDSIFFKSEEYGYIFINKIN